MTIGKYNVSYKDGVSLLKDIKLLKDNKQLFELGEYGIPNKNYANYREEYLAFVEERSYDILLEDDSLIQIGSHGTSYRYAYYQAINEPLSYEDFLISVLGEDYDPSQMDYSYYEDYEQELTERKLRDMPLLFRYDYSTKGYKINIHSCAHLHVGRDNDVRIPCKRELTPFGFIVFIVKHCYSEKWLSLLGSQKWRDDVLAHKNQCELLQEVSWKKDEESDLYLV